MVAAAGRRVDQIQVQGESYENQGHAPGYEKSFLLALQPALEDLAKYRIKLAVNAGNTDTQGLHQVVTRMIRDKELDLKVKNPCYYNSFRLIHVRWLGYLATRS